MAQPHSETKQVVTHMLKLKGWYVIPIQQGAPNLPVYIQKGISDLICIRAGRVVFLEVKVGRDKQSHYQREFEAEILRHGGEYRITHGLDDLGDML